LGDAIARYERANRVTDGVAAGKLASLGDAARAIARDRGAARILRAGRKSERRQSVVTVRLRGSQARASMVRASLTR
jgi:hypothetical protein